MKQSEQITRFEFACRVRARAIELGNGARPRVFAPRGTNIVSIAMAEVDHNLVEFENTPPKQVP